MSDTFNPGPGWRETESWAEYTAADDSLRLDERGGGARYWVREEPVMPLPTEPYTVIRVTWDEQQDDMLGDLLIRDNATWSAVGLDQWHTINDLRASISGFEVLAVPTASRADVVRDEVARATRETASAVLDRVRSLAADEGGISNLHVIAREFGVES